jgi:hypothetical protein
LWALRVGGDQTKEIRAFTEGLRVLFVQFPKEKSRVVGYDGAHCNLHVFNN